MTVRKLIEKLSTLNPDFDVVAESADGIDEIESVKTMNDTVVLDCREIL